MVSIADGAMTKVSDMLTNLQKLKTYANTLLETRTAKLYPAVQSNLNLYKTHLEDKELNITATLQDLLPDIKGRRNGKSEKDLILLMKDFNTSPLNTIRSNIYLNSRALEIKALALLMMDMDSSAQENFEIADYKVCMLSSVGTERIQEVCSKSYLIGAS